MTPKRAIILVVVAFLVSIILLGITQFYTMRNENERAYIKLFTAIAEEKNMHLRNTFFDNVEDIENINWYNFRVIIDNDTVLRNLNLVKLNVYDTNDVLICSYIRNMVNRDVIDDETFVLPYKVSAYKITDVSIKESLYSKIGVVSTSLFFNSSESILLPHLHLVYVFDMSDAKIHFFKFYKTSWVWFLVAIVFLLSLYFLYHVLEKNISNITKYIDYCVNKKSVENPYKLTFNQPFSFLSNKISFCISRTIDLEKQFLNESNNFYNLFNLCDDGLAMEDTSGYIFHCNKKLQEIFEYDRVDDILGLRITDLLYKKSNTDKLDNRLIDTVLNISSNNKVDFLTKNGSKKECIVTKKAMTDEQNNITGYYYVIKDIEGISTVSYGQTELQSLRSKIYDQLMMPIVILNDESNILDVNEAFLNVVNKSRNFVITKSFLDTIKGFELEHRWYPGTKEVIEVFEPIVCKWFYVITKTAIIKNAAYSIIQGYIIDNYRKGQQYNKLIFDDFRGFFFVTNKEYEVVFISPSFLKLTSHSEEWFVDYYKSLLTISLNKSQNLIEAFTIPVKNTKLEFRVTQLYTDVDTMLLFLAVLK